MVKQLNDGYYYFWTKDDYLGFCRTYNIDPYLSEREQYIAEIQHGKCTYTCQDNIGYDSWGMHGVEPTHYTHRKVVRW